jgi:thiamine biosynthesis lipoprotein
MPQIPTKYYHVGTQELFHGQVRIKIPIKYRLEFLDQCFNLLSNIDQQYNSYRKDSYFERINRNAGEYVEVDETTIWLINQLIAISDAVKGIYDISIMPLLKLWGFYSKDIQHVPLKGDLKRTLALVDYSRIEVGVNRVKIGEDQELITGSFIKAYAVDRLIDFLRGHGIDDAIVNAGGSTICGINSLDNPIWNINIPHPLHSDEISRTEVIKDGCFSLSGQANNYIEIENRRYSHILNARTGMPSRTLQVGIFTKEAFWGDAFSTALMASPHEDILLFAQNLKSLYPFTGYLIDESLQYYKL